MNYIFRGSKVLARDTPSTNKLITVSSEAPQSLLIADTILLSILEQEIAGDTFFPPVPEDEFTEISRLAIPGPTPYTRITYHRAKPSPIRA